MARRTRKQKQRAHAHRQQPTTSSSVRPTPAAPPARSLYSLPKTSDSALHTSKLVLPKSSEALPGASLMARQLVPDEELIYRDLWRTVLVTGGIVGLLLLLTRFL